MFLRRVWSCLHARPSTTTVVGIYGRRVWGANIAKNAAGSQLVHDAPHDDARHAVALLHFLSAVWRVVVAEPALANSTRDSGLGLG